MQQLICGILGYGAAAYMYLDFGLRGLIIWFVFLMLIASALKVTTGRAF